MIHRLFRLWIVLALPIACWTAYEAWDAYKSIDFWNASFDTWRENGRRQREDGVYMIFDPNEMTSQALANRAESEMRSEVFLGITIFLLTLPFTGYIVSKISKWVWNGSNPNKK